MVDVLSQMFFGHIEPIKTRGPAESWRDLFDYFNIDYFKIVLKFQVSQVDSALPTQKKSEREAYALIGNALVKSFH